jgi:hypothetical protein
MIQLTPGGRMVKLKNMPTSLLLNGRERNLSMAFEGENASWIAIVICSEHLDSSFLM